MKKLISKAFVIYYFLAFIIANNFHANTITDSLQNNLSNAKSTIETLDALNHFGAYYESVSNYPRSLYYLKKAEYLNQNNQYTTQAIYTNNYIGYVYWHKSDYDNALFYHQNALQLAEKNNIIDENLAFTYLMLGNDYYDKGDFPKTAQYYFKCLKLSEKINNKDLIISCNNRLSKLYFKMKDYKLSSFHANQALKLNNYNNLREQASSYNALGNIALERNLKDSALYYFNKTLFYFQQCGDIIGQSVASINLGDTYFALSEHKNHNLLDSSRHFYKQSYDLNSSIDNQFGMIYGLWGIADIAALRSNNIDAFENYLKSLNLAINIGAKSEEVSLYLKLSALYDKIQNKDSSLFYLKKHLELKNKIESSEQAKQLLKQESKYEFDKKIAVEKAENEKILLVEREKSKWKNIIITMVIVVAFILLFVTLNSIKQLKIIRSKNELINTINQKLSFQKQEIIDSITYAKRIQTAILPSEKLIKEHLPESFILYLPKDIVAGDFYWMETIQNEEQQQKNSTILFAVADCTGHGVPGAMVSVICNNGLNRSVKEFGITNPSEILNKTREIIVSEFEKSDETVKDGMDISLCALNGNQLAWAGANNPLWIIRNHQNEVEELKPNKQHLGKNENPLPYITQTLQLQKGDTIYLFSDGLKDQFGGLEGKKFKSTKIKEILLSTQHLSMEEQKQKLLAAFVQWKGDMEQIDDICFMGVRI